MTAYDHFSGRRSVEVSKHRRSPVVDERERHFVGLHIEVPGADTVEERLAFEVHELMVRLVEHVGMESQRIGDMQVHFRFTEIDIVQPHGIDMDLRIHLRFGEHTRHVRFTGEQTVEHDRLHGQQERHDIRGIDLLQCNSQCILGIRGRHTVRTDMLPTAFERKMVHLQRRVRRTIGDPALRQAV